MPEAHNESEPQKKSQSKIDVWNFPPTWFGLGVGTMIGATLAGGSPWYRPVGITFAGLCVAVAMLLHMRKNTAD